MRAIGVLLSTVAIFAVASVTWAAAPPSFLRAWGTEGLGAGQFQLPNSITQDRQGNLLITDANTGRVQMFTTSGVPIDMLRRSGNHALTMKPGGIAADAHPHIMVTDALNHRLVLLDGYGVFLSEWGTNGSGVGQFDGPVAIAADSRNHMYILDSHNSRIQKFNCSGECMTVWGQRGSGPGQLLEPSGIAADDFGHVFVADAGNHRIQKYDLNGQFMAAWDVGSAGDMALETDGVGNVYVVDTENHRILKFSQWGRLITEWGAFGTGDGEFNRPLDITIGEDGTVYVVDAGNHRVQVFGTPPEISAQLDVDPGPTGNTVDIHSTGMVRMALVGSPSFDPWLVDLGSLAIGNAHPVQVALGDVSNPVSSATQFPCSRTATGPDGIEDMWLKFRVPDLVEVLGDAQPGTHATLTLRGFLRDGTPFVASDCIDVAGGFGAGSAQGIYIDITAWGGARRLIQYGVPAASRVKLSVHDVAGRRIAPLVNDHRARGDYEVWLDTDALPSGAYFVRLRSGDDVIVKKLMLNR